MYIIQIVVYLVLIVIPSTNKNYDFYYHEIDNMEQCERIIKTSKIKIPNNGDAESSIAMYCSPNKPEMRYGTIP